MRHFHSSVGMRKLMKHFAVRVRFFVFELRARRV